jgi:hypothetical protein
LKPGVGCVMVNGSVAMWVSPAEVAVKVTVAVCAWPVDAALKEIFCELPGFSTKVDGCAATPFGNPLRVTEIGPVKPFNAEAEKATWPALPPGVSVKLAGLRLSEKSAAGVIVSVKGTLCTSTPAVPAIAIGTLPVLALGFAERATMTGVPGCTVTGDEGPDTPAGRLFNIKLTGPVKPLTAVAETAKLCAAPPA